MITQRSRTQLREGPACYYPVIAELMKSTPVVLLGEEREWLNISIQDKAGWIAKNTLKEPEKSTFFSMDPFRDATLVVTPASVAAAIKGFSQDFVSIRLGKTSEYDLYKKVRFDIAEYMNFYRETYNDRNPVKVRKRKKLSRNKSVMEFSIELEKIGYSVSLALASSIGLENRSYENYLNQVATLVGSNSHWFDVQFKVLILNSETPTAYATPCGIIFVTTGLLNLVENEAELAALFGHEIAHIIFGHGYREIQERKEMILASELFQELNMELEDEISEAERELTEIASEIYNFLVRNRLDEYEEKADKWGMIYAYRAGYDPNALITVLNRIQSKKPAKKEVWITGHWWIDSIETRIQSANKSIKKELYHKPEYNRLFTDRFRWTMSK